MIVPTVSALPENTALSGSQNMIIQDNAELLSSLKTHVAYIGRLQQARMEGVIQYIDKISGGTGSANLQQIQEDYLIAAFSIPVMRTVDEINTARDEMRQQSILFADETNAQMSMFNGMTDDMRADANSNMHTIEGTFNSVMYSSWLASETTRLTVFNQSSERRTAILDKLSAQGIDTSQAKNLSEQIDAQQSEMENALLQNRDGELQPINSALKQLNQQFRNAIEEYQTNALIQVKTADMMAMM
jgi:DNA repair exonuclease SbcCD ATPase subunit